MRPTRLGVYNSAKVQYPRELTELNGKLYFTNEAGESHIVNPDLIDSGVAAGAYGPSANATASAGGTITVPQVTVDAKGRVTSATNRTITLPDVTHINVTKSTDSTSTAAPTAGSTFTAVDGVTRDSYGHVTKINTKTITVPASYANYSASITTDGWSGTAAPFTKTVTVSGITANDEPVVSLLQNSNLDTAIKEMAAYDKIYRLTTAANSITLYAISKPTTAFTIRLKCVR